MGKGDQFERDCCRYLSKWWTNGKNDDVIWRNRTRRTTKTPKNILQLGDIVATNTIALPFVETFNVEIKTGYSKTKKGERVKNIPWDILDLIDSTKPRGAKVFNQFWEQTLRDARLSERLPLLIFKRDFHVPVACMRTMHVIELEDWMGKIKHKYDYLIFAPKSTTDSIDFFRMDDFFLWLSPEVTRRYHRAKIDKTGKVL